jgi:hypothetical protein
MAIITPLHSPHPPQRPPRGAAGSLTALLGRIVRWVILVVACVLMVAVAVAWPISYSHQAGFTYSSREFDWLETRWVVVGNGRLAFTRARRVLLRPVDATDRIFWKFDKVAKSPDWTYRSRFSPDRVEVGGLEVRHQTTVLSRTGNRNLYEFSREVYVPCSWIVATSGVALGVELLIRRRARRSRIAKNLCGQCGYDLRGGHDRCPECGTPVPNQPTPSPEAPPAQPPASQK